MHYRAQQQSELPRTRTGFQSESSNELWPSAGSAHVALIVFCVPWLLPVVAYLIDVPEVPQHLRFAIGGSGHRECIVNHIFGLSLERFPDAGRKAPETLQHVGLASSPDLVCPSQEV
ncbi:MAG: hypothetical protein FRX49_06008 [Trebouxia sp. A1-2]|nr:MAG: hypothetical protein FRX49_06008 [Trebouxia sp. A1-2]